MSIHKIAPPWGCGDFSALALFLGAGDDTNVGGRNRYHCSYVVFTDGTYYYAENGTTGELDYGGPNDEGAATGTNPRSVIEAAIAALPATGGRIFVKGGVYEIPVVADDFGIDMTDYVTIIGEGTTTEFKLPDSSSTTYYTLFRMRDYCELHNLTINGNKANQVDGNVVNRQMGIYANGETTIKLVNVEIKNCVYQGTYFRNVDDSQFVNSVFHDNGSRGFAIDAPGGEQSINNVVANCIAYNNGGGTAATGIQTGISIGNRVYYTTITGCTSRDNTDYGFRTETVQVTFTGCSSYSNGSHGFLIGTGSFGTAVSGCLSMGNTGDGIRMIDYGDVDDCKVYSNGGNGIYADVNADTKITNCVVWNNDEHGIMVLGLQYGGIISNNFIESNSQDTVNTYDGIRLEDDGAGNHCQYILVANNFILGGTTVQRHGISLDEALNCLIEGNYIYDNASYGIFLDDNTDYTRCGENYTESNATACARVNNANCNNNVFTNNNFDEGNISDIGTNTRAWLNYDPSGNVFIATINAPTVVGGGGGALP